MNRRAWALIVSPLFVLLTACSAIDVDSIPLPGQTVTDGYNLTIEFTTALNLPTNAKVMMDGTRIGTASHVDVAGDLVEVSTRIRSGIQVPGNARASLQQDTLLGDVYIAIMRDVDQPAAPLSDGARLPASQTTSPPQLEDTLSVISYFVSSGSIQRIQNSIIKLNDVTPSRNGELERLATQTAVDLSDLSNNVALVDQWLAGLTDTTRVLSQSAPLLAHYVSPAGMRGWEHAIQVSTYMGTLLPSIGSIYEGGYWLVPMLSSLATTTGTVKTAGLNLIEELPRWKQLLIEHITPFVHDPSIDITSITTPDGHERVTDVEQILRMLGALP